MHRVIALYVTVFVIVPFFSVPILPFFLLPELLQHKLMHYMLLTYLRLFSPPKRDSFANVCTLKPVVRLLTTSQFVPT